MIENIQKNRRQIVRVCTFNLRSHEIDRGTPVDELVLLGQKASEIQQMKQAGFVDTYQHGKTPSFNGFRLAGYGPKIDFVWISSSSIYRVEGETKVDDYHDQNGFFSIGSFSCLRRFN